MAENFRVDVGIDVMQMIIVMTNSTDLFNQVSILTILFHVGGHSPTLNSVYVIQPIAFLSTMHIIEQLFFHSKLCNHQKNLLWTSVDVIGGACAMTVANTVLGRDIVSFDPCATCISETFQVD